MIIPTINSKYRISFLIFIVVGVLPVNVSSQYTVISDNSTINRLFEFMIGFENDLNNSNPGRPSNLFYDSNAEVFNDLDSIGGYLSWSDYRNILEGMQLNQYIIFKHYNMEINKIINYKYYDVIHVNVLRDIIIASEANVIDYTYSKELHFSIIYYKYKYDYPQERFRILRIEQKGDSYLSDSWHRSAIPDEISFHLTPMISSPSITTQQAILVNERIGFNIGLNTSYKIGGRYNNLFLFTAGLGYEVNSSEWLIKDYEQSDRRIDKDNQEYNHITSGDDLKQQFELSSITIPLGLTWRHLLTHKSNLSTTVGVKFSYFTNQDYTIKGGSLNHIGEYIIDERHFTLYDLPSYGFSSYDYLTKAQKLNSFNPYSVAIYGQVNYSYPISKYLSIFVGPYASYYASNMLKSQTPDDQFVINEGNMNPMTLLTTSINQLSYGFDIGIKLNFNNINKTHIQPVRFKREQRYGQKREKKFQTTPRRRITESSADGKKLKIRFNTRANDCNIQPDFQKFPDFIPYKVSSNSVTLFKPYGYNIFPVEEKSHFNAESKIIEVDFQNENEKLNIAPLPPFNLFIININNLLSKKISDNKENVIDIYRSLYSELNQHEECYTLIWKSETKDDKSESKTCYPCNNLDEKIREIKDLINPSELDDNWAETLAIELRDWLTPHNREVNLTLIISDIVYLRKIMLNEDLNKLFMFTDPTLDGIGKIRVYTDLTQLSRDNQIPIAKLIEEYIDSGKTKKSIQLRNIEFFDINE